MAASQPQLPRPPVKPGTGEKLALSAGIAWLLLGGGLLWAAPGTIRIAGYLVPLVLLVAAYLQARQLRLMRREAAHLRETLGDMHAQAPTQAPTQAPPQATAQAFPPVAQPSGASSGTASPLPSQAEPYGAVPLFRSHQSLSNMAEDTPPSFATRRDPAMAQLAAATGPQGQLSLGLDQQDAAPLATPDFLSALNFPHSPEDTDGFRALRLALRHPPTIPLIQASQDVLTLLSQIGLYMDDLIPDHAHPELWRRFFTEGERGGAISALGGVRDTDALLTCANQMRDDPVFRDATHHFLRRFELVLSARIEQLEDADLIRLADTRSARAFMLLGRAAGIFE